MREEISIYFFKILIHADSSIPFSSFFSLSQFGELIIEILSSDVKLKVEHFLQPAGIIVAQEILFFEKRRGQITHFDTNFSKKRLTVSISSLPSQKALGKKT